LDSKEVLLEALDDYGGTLIFVSHDRYFVDKLATKVIEVGNGEAFLYPGGYEDFLYWKKQREAGLVSGPPKAKSPGHIHREEKEHEAPPAQKAATQKATARAVPSKAAPGVPAAAKTAPAAPVGASYDPLAPRLRPQSPQDRQAKEREA